MALAGGFALAWIALSLYSANLAGGYEPGRSQAAWWAVLSWFMLGGALAATIAAVAVRTLPPKD